jgi:transposase
MNQISTKSKKKGTGLKRGKGKVAKNRLEKVNFNAAGIDIGSREHYVCVPEDRDDHPVRPFGCFTSDLFHLADWLEACGIETVVMESTGVYWIPVYQVLEDRGFDVKLADARQVKHVPGRKSDVMDCQWLQELHTYGLLSGAFIPPKDVGVLRSYWRHRSGLVTSCAQQIHLMQKSLDLMNLHLHKVLTDITGQSGMAIIRAIVKGERNAMKLAGMKQRQVKASQERIAEALTGYYRPEHVFSLKQALRAYDFFQDLLRELDQEIKSYMSTLESKIGRNNTELPVKTKRRRKNEPYFDLRAELYRICGVDLTRIDGLDALTVQTIISEIGWDMSRFPTEKNLASYLGLCPNNYKTGGKVKKTKTKKNYNPAAKAFRLAAHCLHSSKSALGAYYRRMRYRLGAPKAITATANKLCRIFYRLLKFGEQYVDEGMDAYERKYRERALYNLKRRAISMNLLLIVPETGEVVS